MKLTERAQQTGSQLPPKLVARAANLIAAKPNRCQASPALRSVQRGKNIHTHHYVSYGLRFLRKSRKGFESRFAVRAMPEMANDLVIQEFCPLRGNNLVVAPNALYAKHEQAGQACATNGGGRQRNLTSRLRFCAVAVS